MLSTGEAQAWNPEVEPAPGSAGVPESGPPAAVVAPADDQEHCVVQDLRASDYAALEPDALIARLAGIAAHGAFIRRQEALAAADLARRSVRELGPASLARSAGFNRPEDLLQNVTGGSRGEVSQLLNTGFLLAQTEAAEDAAKLLDTALIHSASSDDASLDTDPPADGSDDWPEGAPDIELLARAAAPPWFAPVSAAVAAGVFSASVSEAIRAGLGADAHWVLCLSGRGGNAFGIETVEERAERLALVEHLTAAVVAELGELLADCAELTPEQAQKAARGARNRADAAGVLARSEAQHRAQKFSVWTRPDGMIAGSFLLEPENGALMVAVYEQLRHPRRAGVKFRSPEEWAMEKASRGDLREIDEYTADGFIDLLRAGATVDPDTLLDGVKPAVRVITTLAEHRQHALGTDQTPGDGSGFGLIENNSEATPFETIDRFVCTSGAIPLTFEGGQPLNLGHTTRLFSHAQRIVMAARDGGCMDPDCDRPLSWTEAHHIDHWKRDNGNTDVADGIMLCRSDHLRYHNQGYEIRRDTGPNGNVRFWLIPPPGIDPKQAPRLMKAKTALRLKSPVALPAALATPPDRTGQASPGQPGQPGHSPAGRTRAG